MPRAARHNVGKRGEWARQAGYNLSRTNSEKWSVGGTGTIQKEMSEDEARMRLVFIYRQRQKESKGQWAPLPIQIAPPEDDPSWDTWVLLGSRGSGKTEGASRYALDHLRKYGSKARVGVGGKTIADARDTCAEGDSGLMSIAPHEFYYHRSIGEARHVKGGYIKFMGAEEPDRWNGPQWSLLWCDELSLWPKATYDMAQLGLRLGEYPRTIISTTPKTAKWVKEIADLPTTRVTHGTLDQNVYLAKFARDRIIRQFKGTHLEKSELLGQWHFQSPNALWNPDMFHRVTTLPDLARIVIAVDPAVSTGEESDDTGIVAAGIDSYDRTSCNGYIIKDKTCHVSPHGWSEVIISLYDELGADLVVAEVNNGGDLVEAVLRSVALENNRQPIPFKKIHASRGKYVRAQPVASLYEQGRVFHYNMPDGNLDDLETEQCGWDPESYKSPNRMDADVWAITELMLGVPQKKRLRMVASAPVYISRF
jgi:phage terminase large subunit-like protein